MILRLQPPAWATHLLSDLTDWDRSPVPAAEVAPLQLPDDAYFEYAWRDAAGVRRPDPDNPHPRRNPWWPYASNVTGPAYAPESHVAAAAARPAAGRVLRLQTHAAPFGPRRFLAYSPAGLAERPLPHVLVQDGLAYFGWGRLAQTLDLLLQEGAVEPAHLVFVPPLDRTREYAFNPDYVRFLTETILPLAQTRVPCDGRRIAWGASLGGLLSAQVALARPDLFQGVVAQSGAFLFDPEMDFARPWEGRQALLQQILARGADLPALRWHLDCGTLEWLLPSNRRLAEALADLGQDVQLRTRSAGHNWINWRDGLAPALVRMLGAPA